MNRLEKRSPRLLSGAEAADGRKIQLYQDEKEAILEYAGFFIFEEATKNDLKNKRKKWISFTKSQLTDVIGELSYYFNRSKGNSEFYFLDQLISHLEFYERSA